MDRGRVVGDRHWTSGADDQESAVGAYFDVLGGDARQRHGDMNLVSISEDVDWRFPAGLGSHCLAKAKELALQPLCTLQHFAGLSPHPRGRVTNGHECFPRWS